MDDVGCRPGLAGLGDAGHRGSGGIVFSDLTDGDAGQGADQDGPEDAGGDAQGLDDEEGGDQEEAGGDEGRVVQRLGRIDPLEELHRADAEQGEDQADHGQGQGQEHGIGLDVSPAELVQEFGAGRRGDGDGGDDRADVGLEDVGAHAGGVADAVTDVVGDDARVARIVLGDARLDLADQVGADVGGLGVDAAADTGEQGDRRGAHGEAVDVLGGLDVTIDEEGHTDADEAEGGDREAHDGAAVERDGERLGLAGLTRRLGGAHVGAGRGLHADETAGHRADGTAEKGKGGSEAHAESDQEEDEKDKQSQDTVLAAEKGHGTGMDGVGNLPHRLVANRLRLDDIVQNNGDDKTYNTQDGHHYLQIHFFPSLFKLDIGEKPIIELVHCLLRALANHGLDSHGRTLQDAVQFFFLCC